MVSNIEVTSPSQHDTLTYPLAIIHGTTASKNSFIHISNGKAKSHTSTSFPINNHSFIATYLLSPGNNCILLSSQPDLNNPTTLSLRYQTPPCTPPFVRLIYLLAADSDGSFQSPNANPSASNINSAVARLNTAGLMIQSATAEMMHAQGQGRRTFRLAPSVKVHRTTSFTVDEAHNMTCMELWTKIASDLSSTPNRSQIIDLVIMSFTRMRNGEVKAHTALGGASLALFGSGSLFTWPVDVLQIPKRMLDFRTFDTKFFFDDSAGRSSIMGRRACTATTIGALLHELGHCLSLPHPCADATKNGGGIMSRGFDHFDRLFVQPQHATHFPFWDRGSAIRLRHHQFLQFEYERTRFRTQALNNSPMPSSHSAPSDSAPSFGRLFNGIVFCRTQAGLGHVGYYRNGDNASHEEFSGIPPREFELPSLADLRCRCRAKSSDRLVISAIDVQGRISEVDYDQIMDFPA